MSITGCAFSQRAQLLVTCSADSEGNGHQMEAVTHVLYQNYNQRTFCAHLNPNYLLY